jgi:hypothetical protein
MWGSVRVQAPFDTTFDSYFGPGSVFGFPGAPNAVNQPCRLVFYDSIINVSGIGNFEVAWLTSEWLNCYPPNVTVGLPNQCTYDISSADQVAVPSGSAVQYWITQFEICESSGGLLYFRARLAPLPLPF